MAKDRGVVVTISVGSSPQEILQANFQDRLQASITNTDSANPVYLSWGANASTVATTGNNVKLAAGQSVTLVGPEAVYAVAGASVVTVDVAEETRKGD